MNEFMNKEGEGQKKTGKKREREEDKKRERDEGMVGGESGGRRKGSAPWLDLIPLVILGGWRALSIASSCLPSQQEKGFG